MAVAAIVAALAAILFAVALLNGGSPDNTLTSLENTAGRFAGALPDPLKALLNRSPGERSADALSKKKRAAETMRQLAMAGVQTPEQAARRLPRRASRLIPARELPQEGFADDPIDIGGVQTFTLASPFLPGGAPALPGGGSGFTPIGGGSGGGGAGGGGAIIPVADDDGDDDPVVLPPAAVPEPASWALLLLGLTGCAIGMRHRPTRERKARLLFV